MRYRDLEAAIGKLCLGFWQAESAPLFWFPCNAVGLEWRLK